jgi:hypothetical protein
LVHPFDKVYRFPVLVKAALQNRCSWSSVTSGSKTAGVAHYVDQEKMAFSQNLMSFVKGREIL